MTIQTSNRSAGPFVGTGTSVTYAFTFKTFEAADLLVVEEGSDGLQSELVLGGDYTVSLNADQEATPGGYITLTDPLAAGNKLTITSDLDIIQPASVRNAGRFYPGVIEDALDRIVMLVQQQQYSSLNRTLRVPEVDGAEVLPAAADRASKLLGFDADGKRVLVKPIDGSALELSLALAGTDGTDLIGYGAGTLADKLAEFPSVLDKGADKTGVIPATAAFQELVNEMIAISDTQPVLFRAPPGSYRINGRIDFTALAGKRWSFIGGDGYELTEILVDMDDHDDIVFALGDESAPDYQRQICLGGFLFRKYNSAHKAPVAISAAGIAQSRINNIACAEWDNTVVRSWAPQNCRAENWTLYGGGRSFLYKDASAVSVKQTGTSLESDANIFTLADEGKVISIWGGAPNYTRRKTKVLTYVDAKHVTVDSDYTDSVWYDLHFGSPFITTTVGSGVITADAPCFAAGDVGLVVYIPGAGADGRMLRGKIVEYISDDQVRLDTTAGTAITTGEIACPAIDIHSTGSAAGEGGSDNTFHAVQVESHAGVALVLSDQDILTFTACKLHGNQSPDGEDYSLAPLWAEQVSGSFQGAFDAQTLGAYKARVTYQSSCFNFENLVARVAKGEQLMRIGARASGFEGGLVQFDDITVSNASSGLQFRDLIADANSPIPGYVLSGKVSFNDVDDTRVYLGNTLYGTPYGVFDADDLPVRRNGDGGVVDATLSSTITWDGTAPSLGASHTYSWQRMGQAVQFTLRVSNSTAGVGNTTLTIALPADMPTPAYSAGVAASETICMLAGGLATAETAAPSGVARLRRDSGGTGFEFVVSAASMAARCGYVNGQYFTE